MCKIKRGYKQHNKGRNMPTYKQPPTQTPGNLLVKKDIHNKRDQNKYGINQCHK